MSAMPRMGRSIDHLGRIVIPMEIRRSLGLHPGSTLAVSLAIDRVVLRPLQITDDPLPCLFCGEDDPSVLRSYRGRSVCDRCRANLSRIHHSPQADPPSRPMPVLVRRSGAAKASGPKRARKFVNQNVHKTHCPRGHPYSGSNLYIDPKGNRRCRACKSSSRRRVATAQP